MRFTDLLIGNSFSMTPEKIEGFVWPCKLVIFRREPNPPFQGSTNTCHVDPND